MNPYQNHSDSELIALIIEGEKNVFEVIYQKYALDLYRFARKNIPLKEDCEEIVQDVFESLWVKRTGLQHLTSLRPYLFKMVKYKIVDYLRHSLVRRKYEEHYLLFEDVYDNLTGQINEGIDFQTLLAKSIEELPTRCQTAFRLRISENMAYKDIAETMQISTKAVEKHISAALQHMRDAYANAYKASS